ncbi:glycoside hydrolase [Shewanella fidelis]|uniref:Glycoside hydrolase n=1 Tax=Shewanella fidelis TaxID=173509 RepID=A0AAW8NQ63_9GAMM|nr:glycoside hydrolase [Shewanella fidelis]MDR8524505.1 glycoside hydrolase [Shewanella fidelis]MDW4811981.1 glycoside hydrolase [Shewanella fidelis]MDW4817080.1 glycoside hydrolase [Shewanella fidelis]MDW4821150.1 glycoside hydrolase [Shewanella fidelis]MDW4822587.1 glycoside hydrolase [Shewanella fidelis]
MAVNLYTVFHLNLAFSSIEQEQHLDVIKHCYWPLLKLAQQGIPVGIEMTAYTLECIAKVDSKWIALFRSLLQQQKCELIASGDSQIIGPLIPAEVNRANLVLGQKSYQQQLQVTPKIAYINEQATSAGLLDVYIDVGFEAVVVEWDNPYSHNPNWTAKALERPQSLTAASGREIKVIWNNAIAFQKFQRYAHGELPLADYTDYLSTVCQQNMSAFPIYGSDAEVFDFRPGRYQTETKSTQGEWQRIAALFNFLATSKQFNWQCPSEILNLWQKQQPLALTNAEHPVSVKKQAKYNITRWALSGRNDLLLNTLCYQQWQQLKQTAADDSLWRSLCRMWSSDLRTHLTQSRYDRLNLAAVNQPAPVFESWQNQYQLDTEQFKIDYDAERHRLHVRTPHLALSLNANRGLAIEQLSFSSQQFKPTLATLSHGYFDHISYGADFYSNHILFERFRDRDRVTDLNKVDYHLGQKDGNLVIYCHQKLKTGGLLKWYMLEQESVHCGFHFEDSLRPEAAIRLGFITMQDCSQRPWYACHLGGYQKEHFQLSSDIDQGAPVSSLVSANSAIGATNGELLFGVNNTGIQITWDPAKCAALPMISSKKINHQYLNRVWFSLAEADETLKQNGTLLDFEYCIKPTCRRLHD